MFNNRKISYAIGFYLVVSFHSLAQGCGDQEIDCDEFMPNEKLAERACTAGEKGEDLVINYINPVLDCIFPGTDDHNFMNRVAAVESNFGKHPKTYRSGYHGGIYQVDRIAFEDTKNVNSHPRLVNKTARVERITGINWLVVKWKDLRKPLYSGIAARLFISNVEEEIPESIKKQAPYWKNKYNKSNKDVDKDIQRFVDVAWKNCKNKTEAKYKCICKDKIVYHDHQLSYSFQKDCQIIEISSRKCHD